MGVIEHSNMIDNAVTLGGGGGSLTPPATLTGTESAATILTVAGAAAQSAPYVIIKRDADWQGGTMIEGQDETTAQLWYADENGDGYFSHDLSLGRALHGAWFAMTDDCTITGSLSVTSLNSSGAVGGASATITGEVQAGSVAATGNVRAASVTATGSVTGATLATTGGTFTLGDGDSGLLMADSPTPPTPDSGIVLWSAGGVLKWKGPDGVVH